MPTQLLGQSPAPGRDPGRRAALGFCASSSAVIRGDVGWWKLERRGGPLPGLLLRAWCVIGSAPIQPGFRERLCADVAAAQCRDAEDHEGGGVGGEEQAGGEAGERGGGGAACACQAVGDADDAVFLYGLVEAGCDRDEWLDRE